MILAAGIMAAMLSPVFAHKRVALIIGNSAYQHVQHLRNPVNDANDLAAMLTSLGFKVKVANNLDRPSMELVLSHFADAAVGADIALVYYAGHGIEVDGRNYLIPIDAKLETDRRISFEAISLHHVLAALEGVQGLRIVLLDACRNNPFLASMKVTAPSRSVEWGLAAVEAPKSTLISFSAKEGTTAADGIGRNSPYASALLHTLNQPGLEIGLLFRRVRDRVMKETNNQQEPFVSASLSSKPIYLVPPPKTAVPLPQPKPNLAAAVWDVTKDTDSAKVLRAFIARYKGTVYADLAGARLKEVMDNAAKAKASKPAPPKSNAAQKKLRTTSLGTPATTTSVFALVDGCRSSDLGACEKLCSMGRSRACNKVRCLKGIHGSCRHRGRNWR